MVTKQLTIQDSLEITVQELPEQILQIPVMALAIKRIFYAGCSAVLDRYGGLVDKLILNDEYLMNQFAEDSTELTYNLYVELSKLMELTLQHETEIKEIKPSWKQKWKLD